VTPATPATNGHAGGGAGRASFAASRHRQGDVPGGLISLRTLRGALRRRAWLVCAAAVAGLAVSGALFVLAPPAYQAATSILITNNPDLDAAGQMQGNVTLAESLPVSATAVHELGLNQSVTTFAHSYTVAAPTDQLLQITANASSASDAERRANAVAAAFMQDRAQQLEVEQRIEVATLNQQIAPVNAELSSIARQIAAVAKMPKSSVGRGRNLSRLSASLLAPEARIGALKYEVGNYPLVTLSMIKGTRVLDVAAPIPPSRKRVALMTGIAGLVAGLTVGFGIVLVDAAASDRLRRRRDIARVLGAPIRLTIGKPRMAGRLPGGSKLAAASAGDMPRLVAHLRSNVRDGAGTAAALAVVAVGNADVAAPALVRLATAYARNGKRVLLADLADGAPAAGLLRVKDPGVHFAGGDGERIVVALPEPSDRVPVGPLRRASQGVPRVRPDKALATVYASADVLLTIATLDPACGAEHLATWATDAVVVVTAGRSAAPTLKSTGEMIRLAGMRLVSAVLVGADKADDSLGAAPASSGRRRRPLTSASRQSISA
jgi:capsular polysaccharide biosynthesis protein